MSERVVKLLIESFPKILLPGLKMTIPLTVIAFSIAMVIAVIAAMIQYARVPVLRQIMRFYVWVVRGTPLLVQLFVVFYGLPYAGHHAGPVSGGGDCLLHQRGRVLRRDDARGAGIRTGGADGGGLLRGHELLADHAPHCAAAGAAHGVPAAVQFSLIAMVKDTSLAANITVTEMFMATQTHCGAYYYEPLALYMRGRRDLPAVLHGADVGAALRARRSSAAYGAQKE